MSSVGVQLQEARARLHLSLADVTRETKIQTWVLEALEEDRLQELMSPIYVKGFVITYGKYLRLEPESLMAQLKWPVVATTPLVITSPEPSMLTKISRRSAPLMRHLGAALALSAAVVMLALVSKPMLRRVSAKWPVFSKGRVVTASLTTGEKVPKIPELPTLTLLATQPLELDVTAHRQTWITVRADGKLLAQQKMVRGAQEHWNAKKQLEIIVTQPSDVELTLNGQPISPFAIAHRGRLLITHRGVTQLRSDVR